MKQKILTIIVAVEAVIIVALALTVLLFFNKLQPVLVPVPYDGTLTHTHGYDGSYLSLYFHSNRPLFNCAVTISYIASNGTTVQIDKPLGVVDVNAMNLNYGFSLNDYPIPASSQSSTNQFNENAPLETITIKALGSTTP